METVEEGVYMVARKLAVLQRWSIMHAVKMARMNARKKNIV